jgi:predicted Fe-Mo cluster-binding NifX family protein
MKVVFTTSGDDLDAPFESRFGRAPKFLVYDLEADTYEVVENARNVIAVQGAGMQAAETVARLGAGCLVTGHCGPNAFRVLSAAGIKVFNADAPTVAAALDLYRSGRLVESDSADVEGHWA